MNIAESIPLPTEEERQLPPASRTKVLTKKETVKVSI